MFFLGIIVICCKLSFVITAGQADFDKLRMELELLYSASPRLVPLVVRLAFHDLFHQKIVGGRGCIQKQAFLNLKGNAGLVHPINVLKQVLKKPDLNDIDFKFGDVIAFASKVAVETAYPCIRVKFKFNRQDCEEEEPIKDLPNSIPEIFLVDLKELQLKLDYLGLDLTEFAVIMAGAHGIQGAQSHNEISGAFGTFSQFSSGKDYILQTLNNDWSLDENNQGSAFFTGSYLTRLIRLPLDILLFSNQTRSMGDAESIKQELLQRANSLPRSLFDKSFAAAFEKLLMIGGGTQDLQDHVQILQRVDNCIDPGKISTVAATTSDSTAGETSNHARNRHLGNSGFVLACLFSGILSIFVLF